MRVFLSLVTIYHSKLLITKNNLTFERELKLNQRADNKNDEIMKLINESNEKIQFHLAQINLRLLINLILRKKFQEKTQLKNQIELKLKIII